MEYIPARREIWFNETVKISLELSPGTEDEQDILARTRQRHEDWTEELEQAMANPEDVRPLAPNVFSPITGPGRWVLILPGNPEHLGRDTWESTFQPLINHRQNQGLDVEHIYVRQITTASGEAAVQDIRLYLRDQHEYHGAQWVCLVGDHEMIPWTYFNPPSVNPDVPNDWCYCDLDGAWPGGPGDYDWAPEMWVGRVPCITKQEGENFVNKVLAYEQNPGNGDHEYLKRAFYEQETNNTCPDVIAHQHPDLEDTLWSATLNPPWPYDYHVIDEICTKHHNYVIVHCHGFFDCYETTPAGEVDLRLFQLVDIEALWNEDYYYFWYSISCKNAEMDWDDPSLRSIAEGATCIYPNRCAVAFGGNTRYGYFGTSTQLNWCAWDVLFPGPFVFPRHFNHVGSVEANSKLRSDNLGVSSNYVRYSHNLFGDPATPIWTPDYMPGSQKPLLAEDAVKPIAITRISCDPMPVGDIATLRFRLNRTARVLIGVYDINGRLVQNLGEQMVDPGERSQRLDCSGLAPGLYVVKLRAGTEEARAKLVVLR